LFQRGLPRPTEHQRLTGRRFSVSEGFRLFPTEPRRIWFGQRKANVSSRLPFRANRTFHRSSAPRHAIRDTRSGRGAVRRCAGLRVLYALNAAWGQRCRSTQASGGVPACSRGQPCLSPSPSPG